MTDDFQIIAATPKGRRALSDVAMWAVILNEAIPAPLRWICFEGNVDNAFDAGAEHFGCEEDELSVLSLDAWLLKSPPEPEQP